MTRKIALAAYLITLIALFAFGMAAFGWKQGAIAFLCILIIGAIVA